MQILFTGEDKTLKLDLADADGNVLNYADLDDMKVIATINRIVVAKYSKEPLAGFDDITIGDNAHQAQILLTRQQTSTFSTGMLRLQIDMIITDADFNAGRLDSQEAEVFEVKKGTHS
jgi:hypothetical protein